MNVLLIEPNYYTRFPPLGLLKLATYHKMKGDVVQLLRGNKKAEISPDRIYVTSLFTYAWKAVHESVKHYKKMYPSAEVWLGGIYASLMKEHAKKSGADHIFEGIFHEAENLMPDYTLIPEWDGSIIFSSRGCIRECSFCAVPKLEGKPNSLKYSIKDLIHPKHTKVILWDNNILANPNWENIFDELITLNLKVDFNQGIDARLISEKSAEKLSRMKISLIRLAYDTQETGPKVHRAINLLHEHGIRKKKIVVYTLFNYEDNPDDFFQRVKDILNWGAACYPMRFEPLNSLEKNQYLSKNWTYEEIRMVQKARRVLGFGGTFPPYKALIKKFNKSKDFNKAFELRPIGSNKPLSQRICQYLKVSHNSRGTLSKARIRWGREKDWRKALTSKATN